MSQARRWLVVVVAVVFAALAALSASRLAFDGDVARMLPDSDPAVERFTKGLRRVMDRMVVELSLPDADEDALGHAADRFCERVLASGLVGEARTQLFDASAIEGLGVILESLPRLVPAHWLEEVADRLEPERMSGALEALFERLNEPDGLMARQRAAVDPLGLSDVVLRRLESLMAGFRDVRLVNGRLFSQDGTRHLFFLVPTFPATDTSKTSELLGAMAGSLTALRTQPGLAGLGIRHLSAYRSTLDNARQIQDDVKVTSSVGGILVALIAVLALARVTWGVLALAPAAFGIVISLGCMALFRDTIVAAASGFGVVVLGLAVDYAIHALYGLARQDRRVPVRALMMGATTTAVAFATLGLSDLPAIREIGVLGSIGILASAAFAILVLPALAGRGKRRRAWLDLEAAVRWVRRRKYAVGALVVVIIMTPVLFVGAFRVEMDGDPSHLSSLSPDAQADEAGLESTWGEAFRVTQVVVEAPSLEDALRQNDEVARVLEGARDAGVVRAFGSVGVVVPSLETQAANLAAWRHFWSPERLARTREDLDAARAETRFRAGAFEPFFDWVLSDPDPLVPGASPEDALYPIVRDRIVQHEDGFLVSTPVFLDGWERVVALREHLVEVIPSAYVLNREAAVRQLAEMVGRDAWQIGAVALGAVAALILLWFGSVELTILVIVPLLVSAVWTLGFLGWLGVPINFVNAIFGAFLFGLAVDYSIFLAQSRLDRFRGGHDATVESDAAVVLCAGTTCVGFGMLMLAGHPVLFTIGATALIGIACAATSTMILVPLMCGLILRRPGPGGTFRLRHLGWSLWVFLVMVGGGLRFMAWTRWRTPRASRSIAARAAIRSICRYVRDRVPGGLRRVEGTDPDPFSDPCVIVANHESHYDQVALFSLVPQATVLVKRWVDKLPLVGSLGRTAGFIVADDAPVEAMLKQTRAAVEEGASVIVYPEGTRSRGSGIARFRNGAFALARALNLRVVPVALINTRSVCRPGTWWIGDHDALTVVLDPVHPRDFEGESGDRRMARAVRDRIQQVYRARLGDVQHAFVWRRSVEGMWAYHERRARRRVRRVLRDDALVERLPGLVPGDDPVVVLGCGDGVHVARLAMRFPERRILGADEHSGRGVPAFSGDDRVTFHSGRWPDGVVEHPCSVVMIDLLAGRSVDERSALLEELRARLPVGTRVVVRERAGEHDGRSVPYPSADSWCTLLRAFGLDVEVRIPADARGDVVLAGTVVSRD